MIRLPIVDAKTMEKALLRGFAAVRQKGSHVFYRHADGRTTTVPHHVGRDLGRPLVRSILRDIDVSPEEFAEVVKRPLTGSLGS
jgi:predicted RNA binding protein YcfA (HicA-like mRNA interferase family)